MRKEGIQYRENKANLQRDLFKLKLQDRIKFPQNNKFRL